MPINLDKPTPIVPLIAEELQRWDVQAHPASGFLNGLKQKLRIGTLRMREQKVPVTAPVANTVEQTDLTQGINAYLGYPASRAEILTARRGHHPSTTPAFGLLDGEDTTPFVPTLEGRARSYSAVTDKEKLIRPAEELEATREALLLYAVRVQSHRGLASLIMPNLDNDSVAAAFEQGRLARITTFFDKLSARVDDLAAPKADKPAQQRPQHHPNTFA